MKIVRALAAIGAILLAVATALLFLAMLILVTKTLQNGAEIDQAFWRTSTWIDNFKLDNGRLPTDKEVVTWSTGQKQTRWLGSIEVIWHPSPLPDEVRKTFGPSPNNGYMLRFWRGEWYEYFASWTKTSTVSGAKDTALFIVEWLAITAALFALSFFLWRFGRPTRRSSGPPKAPLLSSAEL